MTEFPLCQFAGRTTELTGSRMCRLGGRRKFVTIAYCSACPLAGVVNPDFIPEGAPIDYAKLPTCSHRGDVKRIETCELCGSIGKKVPVYACGIHGECTESRFKAGKSPHTCVGCADHSEVG